MSRTKIRRQTVGIRSVSPDAPRNPNLAHDRALHEALDRIKDLADALADAEARVEHTDLDDEAPEGDWADREGLSIANWFFQSNASLEDLARMTAGRLREVACDCPMASPLVRPELESKTEGDPHE